MPPVTNYTGVAAGGGGGGSGGDDAQVFANDSDALTGFGSQTIFGIEWTPTQTGRYRLSFSGFAYHGQVSAGNELFSISFERAGFGSIPFAGSKYQIENDVNSGSTQQIILQEAPPSLSSFFNFDIKWFTTPTEAYYIDGVATISEADLDRAITMRFVRNLAATFTPFGFTEGNAVLRIAPITDIGE